MDNICELFDELLVLIIEHLSDHDKVKFMTTCSRLYHFIDKVNYENIYDYNKIYHLEFTKRFKRIRFHAVNESIPSIITDLTLDEEFSGSLENCKFPRLTYIKLSQNQYDTNKNYIPLNTETDIQKPFGKFRLIKFDILKLLSNNYYLFSGTDWSPCDWSPCDLYPSKSIIASTITSIRSHIILDNQLEFPKPEVQENFRPIFSTESNNNKSVDNSQSRINKSLSQKKLDKFYYQKKIVPNNNKRPKNIMKYRR
ncbi:putative F-box protein [Niemeyer virus]|uniref:F-box protein n=1 Tax=Acanthamoeba polyphaga mimivirus Kroon TaxID=3069720 RepID=A0A0G2Y2B8_9VIRU|nr:putative F-box protein [Acanthamoeba polyphaga mimivirus]AKI79898.1 putative F-box protein [Acanthamoeba polyphaga mimivirus Kroon]ALR83731.1 putative F-box protein [Niemeyer virus]